MAGISPEALCALDVEWYGLDALGQVAVFCSGGTGIVPDFVCADQEKQERLVELSDELPANSETVLHFVPSKKNPLPVRVAQGFSGKGFFYYDADDGSRSMENICVLQSYYTLRSAPTDPIHVSELPAAMQALLREQILPVLDFSQQSVIRVEHGNAGNEGLGA